MSFYLEGDTEREIREALRRGASLELLAGKVLTTPENLASVLGLKPEKPVRADRETGVDLWRADELNARL